MLRDGITAAHQTGGKPRQQRYSGSYRGGEELRRITLEVISRPKRANDGQVVADANETDGYAQHKVNWGGPKPGVRQWRHMEVGGLGPIGTRYPDRAR